jgi:hypothetical protein
MAFATYIHHQPCHRDKSHPTRGAKPLATDMKRAKGAIRYHARVMDDTFTNHHTTPYQPRHRLKADGYPIVEAH